MSESETGVPFTNNFSPTLSNYFRWLDGEKGGLVSPGFWARIVDVLEEDGLPVSQLRTIAAFFRDADYCPITLSKIARRARSGSPEMLHANKSAELFREFEEQNIRPVVGRLLKMGYKIEDLRAPGRSEPDFFRDLPKKASEIL